MKTFKEKLIFSQKTYFKLILRSYKFLIGLIILHSSLLAVLLALVTMMSGKTKSPGTEIIQDFYLKAEELGGSTKIFNAKSLLIDKNSQRTILLDFTTKETQDLSKTENFDHLSTDYKSYWMNEVKILDTITFDGQNLTFTSWQANYAPITDKEKLFRGVTGGFIAKAEIYWYFKYVSDMFISQTNILKLFNIETKNDTFFASYLKKKGQLKSSGIIRLKFAWKLALAIFLIGCSFILRVYGDLVENNNTTFFYSIGISKFIQLFTFFSLNLVTTAPAMVLISLLLCKIDSTIGSNWHFTFYLLQAFVFSLIVFFLDIVLISLTGKSSFWHRNFPFFLVMFFTPFKATIDENLSNIENLLLCLHPWTSLSYLHDKQFGEFEVDLNESVVFCMELIGLLLFGFLSLFIFFMSENLILNPLSLIKLFWCKKRKGKEKVRKLSMSKDNFLHCFDVTKKYFDGFSVFTAVKRVSVIFERGEKIALLGHNGAGKSTFMNCLIGMIRPTDGAVFFKGKEIKKPSDLAGHIGYSSQYGACLLGFTVDENIDIMLAFYENSSESPDKEFVLRKLGLDTMRTKFARELSGGQRRKLDFAMAIVAKPEIVVLDEPSTGVDVLGVEKMTELVSVYLPNSLVILSTHITSEAEAIANRILIMNGGELAVCDSLVNIRKQFGLNSHRLTVNFDSVTNKNEYKNKIQKELRSLTSATIIKESTYKTVYKIDIQSAEALACLYEWLCENKNKFSIESFGIRMATIDEVLDLAEFREVSPNKTKKTDETKLILDNGRNRMNTFFALFYKRFSLFFSSFYYFVSILSFLVIFQKITSVKKVSAFPRKVYSVTPDKFTRKQISVVVHTDEAFQRYLETNTLLKNNNKFKIIYTNTFEEFKNNVLKEDVLGYILEAKSIDNHKYLLDETNKNIFDVSLLKQNGRNKVFISTMDGYEQFQVPLAMMWRDFTIFRNKQNIQINLTGLKIKGLYSGKNKIVLDNLEKTLKNGELNISNEVIVGGVSSMLNNKIFLFIGENMVISVFISMIVFMMVGNYLEADYFSNGRKLEKKYGLPILGSCFFDILIDALFFSGLHIFPLLLWNPSLLNDAIAVVPISVLSLLTTITMFARLGSNSFLRTIIVTFAVYPPCLALIKASFRDYNIPRLFTLINPFQSYYSLIIFFSIDKNMIQLLFLLFDHFVGTKKVLFKNGLPFFRLTTNLDVLGFRVFARRNALVIFAFSLFILIIAEYDLLFFLNFLLTKKRCKKSIQEILKKDAVVDESVTAECENVKSLVCSQSTDFEESVIIKDLSKAYGKFFPPSSFVALSDLTLCLKPGESVGLLGSNGGGKSTAFKILVREEIENGGSLFLGGRYVFRKGIIQFLTNKNRISYTPQYESFSMNLSACQIFTYYNLLAGYSFLAAKRRARKTIQQMKLHKNRNKAVGRLSGGNRKKVAIGLAVQRNDKLLILDEPTTGVDITNRKDIWEIIGKVSRNNAFILASHSMEETEELCSKVVVLVKGKVKCVGTSEKLKQKFGKFFVGNVIFFNSDANYLKLNEELNKRFGQSEVFQPIFKVSKISIQKGGNKIQDCIRFISGMQSDLGIETFDINESSLQDVLSEHIKETYSS